MKQGLAIALLCGFFIGVLQTTISREVERRAAVHVEDCQSYGYGMNQWARSEGRPDVCL